MRVEEVLSKLEKHEAECNLRYTRIEERRKNFSWPVTAAARSMSGSGRNMYKKTQSCVMRGTTKSTRTIRVGTL